VSIFFRNASACLMVKRKSDGRPKGLIKNHPVDTPPAPAAPATFSSLDGLNPTTLKVLTTTMGMPTMTDVQAASLPHALKGCDMLVQAKTGTGKTLCFLLPILERILALDGMPPEQATYALILTPTRELAQQVRSHALPLFTAHGFKIHAAVGGTDIDACREHVVGYYGLCHAVVATPGRIKDHLGRLELARKAMRALLILVLDEVDQMLDPSFWVPVTGLLKYLPPTESRQTLLFSATVPFAVKRAARWLTRPESLREVRLSSHDEAKVHTHVPQQVVVVPAPALLFTLVTLVRHERAIPGHKVIVFFITACLTSHLAKIFKHLGAPVFEMHAKMASRQTISNEFREAPEGVLFTSDVSARGMDYPDVTCVIQVGMAHSLDFYIHRLGRTARAGKNGHCYTLLCDLEKAFVETIAPLGAATAPVPFPADLERQVADIQTALEIVGADQAACDKVYTSWWAYYSSAAHKLQVSPEAVTTAAVQFTASLFNIRVPTERCCTPQALGFQLRLSSKSPCMLPKPRKVSHWGSKTARHKAAGPRRPTRAVAKQRRNPTKPTLRRVNPKGSTRRHTKHRRSR